jgi:hypothetical protein
VRLGTNPKYGGNQAVEILRKMFAFLKISTHAA